MNQHLKLPEPIAAYFQTDRFDGDTVARCFANDAVVKDESHTYTGRDAIARWKADVSRKYTYTSEPFAFEQQEGFAVVTSRLTGNFPGSPVDLRYRFRLERGKISALEIIP